MAFKVLLGLLAAVGVTGAAVFYGAGDGPTQVAGGCSGASAMTCPLSADLSDEPRSCAAGKSKTLTCCEEVEQATGRMDAAAALTGGVALGR